MEPTLYPMGSGSELKSELGHCQIQIRPLGVETGQYRKAGGALLYECCAKHVVS
jgi:hypothetical protein